jgi:type III secretory pathway component EscS
MTDGDDGTSRLPECVVGYIESVVQSLDLRRRVCAEVRRELEHHFEDALCCVEGEPERARRAEELIAEFGDEALLATLIRRGKIRCQKEIAMNISGIVGLGLLALIIGSAVNAGYPLTFMQLPWLCMCVGMTAALGMMSFGFHDLVRGVRALRVLFVRVPPETISSREVSVLRGLIPPVYVTGVIGTLIGLTNALGTMEDPSMMVPATAVLLVVVLYPVLLAECLIRPAVRLIEHGEREGEDTPHISEEGKAETEVESA